MSEEKISSISDLRYELFEEMQIIELLKECNSSFTPFNSFIIKGCNIVSLEEEQIIYNKTIRVQNGVIREILDESDDRYPSDVKVINLDNKFVLPGLIDMHVHLNLSNVQHLLHLINGITTVREMCGFPWVLKLREEIRSNRVFAPSLFVASNMLNNTQFERYTSLVENEFDALKFVTEFKKMGYDFVKIWNIMPYNLLELITKEAKKQNIATVAHIPHGISVEQAVSLGIRTFEHFKGYLDDSTMKLTGEDYTTVTSEHNYWNCPTFVVFKTEALIGIEATNKLETDPSYNYISKFLKKKWIIEIDERTKKIENGFPNIPKMHFELQEGIFRNLHNKGGYSFVAGTDFGGGYALCVPGFGLLDELDILIDLGMSNLEVLKSVTINSSEALEQKRTLGSIDVGSIGNLLILDDNPLVNLDALRAQKSIIVNGRYLTKPDLHNISFKVKKIYQQNFVEPEIEIILNFFENPENIKFLKPYYLELLIQLLQSANYRDKRIKIYRQIANMTENAYDYDVLRKIKENSTDHLT